MTRPENVNYVRFYDSKVAIKQSVGNVSTISSTPPTPKEN
jgi:hypothetical protein